MSSSVNTTLQPSRLVVFDFDWSLIDANSDTWILEQLNEKALEHVKAQRKTIQWTKLMNEAVQIVQDDGIHHNDILSKVAEVPVEDEMVEAIRLAHDMGAHIAILSDANTLYIEAFLKKHNLDSLVHHIVTNHALITESGRLQISSFHPEQEPHGCHYCPVNLCKGRELQGVIIPATQAHLPEGKEHDQIIYIGDGSGDLCPATKLRTQDLLLVRNWDERPSALGLVKRMEKYPGEVQAKVEYFKTGKDILKIFQNVFGQTFNDESI